MKQLLFLSATFLRFLEVAHRLRQVRKLLQKERELKSIMVSLRKETVVIFGKLVPFGEVWRTGANEATEITFDKDVTVGGKPVKAGTYTLFTVPKETEWTVILNGQLKQWGAFDYEKYKDKDVAQFTVPSSKTSSVVEKLTYSFTPKNDLVIAWDDRQISIPIK